MWLLVEDDSDIRMVVAMMMTVWGEEPLPLSDGKAAWAWLDEVEAGAYSGPLPDLALLDIRMPGYTGDQIAARMRTMEKLKDIPIILMTAFSLSEAEVALLRERCGVDHLLNKPLPDLDDFRGLLYRVRDQRRDAQHQQAVAPAGTPPAEPITALVTLPPMPPPVNPTPDSRALGPEMPDIPAPADAGPGLPPAPSPDAPPATPPEVQTPPAITPSAASGDTPPQTGS